MSTIATGRHRGGRSPVLAPSSTPDQNPGREVSDREVSDTWVWAAGQVRVRGGARLTGCRTRVFSFAGAVRRGSER